MSTSPTSTSTGHSSGPLTPRTYQTRIFLEALKPNRNVIAVGPTGSGKTLISGLLIESFLQRDRPLQSKPKSKIVFLVNRVLLVHQQEKFLSEFLEQRRREREQRREEEQEGTGEGYCVGSVEIPCRIGKYWGEDGVSRSLFGVIGATSRRRNDMGQSWGRRRSRRRGRGHSDSPNRSSGPEDEDVWVMTSQIFLNLLRLGRVGLSQVSLLIFDECHHCLKRDPYARIMKEYYFRMESAKRPKIFGMSASPFTIGAREMSRARGAKDTYLAKLERIQKNLDATVYQIGSTEGESVELEIHVPAPKVLGQPYHPLVGSGKIASFVKELLKHSSQTHLVDFFSRAHNVLTQLGTWGLWAWLNLTQQRATATNSADNEGLTSLTLQNLGGLGEDQRGEILVYVHNLMKQIEDWVGEHGAVPKIHQLSNKMQVLVEILRKYESEILHMCGLVFVERRVIAWAVCKIISSLGLFGGRIGVLLGHGCVHRTAANPDRSSQVQFSMASNQQQALIQEFGKTLDLVVTTNVAEEGIDIQACHLVVRFDMFPDLKAYVQSRGRARQKNSDYVVMYDQTNEAHKKMLMSIGDSERRMIAVCCDSEGRQVRRRESIIDESEILRIEASGASLSCSESIEKLRDFCLRFPRDRFSPAPCAVYQVFAVSGSDQVYARITFPSSSSLDFSIKGKSVYGEERAKQFAALEALRELHVRGLLDDHFFPSFEIHRFRPSLMSLKEQEARLQEEKTDLLRYAMVHSPSHFARNWVECLSGRSLHLYDFVSDTGSLALGFLADSRLPSSMPRIEVYRWACNIPVHTSDVHSCGTLTLSDRHLEILARFHLYVCSVLLGWRRFYGFGLKAYLIVPILQKKIDWGLIIDCLRESHSMKQGDVIVTKHAFGLHVVESVSPRGWTAGMICPFADAGPKETTFKEHLIRQFPQYSECSIADGDPVLEVRSLTDRRGRKRTHILPEFASIVCWSEKEVMEMKRLIPPTFWFLEKILLIDDLNRWLEQSIDLRCLRQATTAPLAGHRLNYDRLEFLGDQVLKICVARNLFFRFPDFNCVILSRWVRILTSNLFLCERASEYHLERFLFTEFYSRRQWSPPGFESGRTRYTRILHNKMFADFVEALCACTFLSGDDDFASTTRFLIKIGFDFVLNPMANYSPVELKCADALYRDYCFEELEEALDYSFVNKSLLVQAFAHQSFRREGILSYQRLELLGDAIIGVGVAKFFFDLYPNASAESFHELMSVAVSNALFAHVIFSKRFHRFLLHESDLLKSSIEDYGREFVESEIHPDEPKVLADVFESLIAAIYIDLGYNYGRTIEITLGILRPFFDLHGISPDSVELSPCRRLTELLQKHRVLDFWFVQRYCHRESPSGEEWDEWTSLFVARGQSLGQATARTESGARKECAKRALRAIESREDFFDGSDE